LDRLDTALKNGRGVMLILAHYGANQMVMSAVGHRGYRMDQLGAPASVWDRVINDRSTTPMKRRGLEIRAALEDTLPANILDPEKKLKEALKGLKENHVLGVAADGAAGEGWIACPFLGRRIRLGKGPFGILKATGCEALPAFMVRDRSGRQCLQIGKPLALPTEMGKDAAISEGAARFAKVLEDYVRQRPGHYLHFLALRRRMAGLGDPPRLEPAGG
ncbi:MAG: lauroyl acyltransferase, partial [Gemmatimonadales bacterium]